MAKNNTDRAPKATSAGINFRIILVAVLVLAVVGVMAFLVYRNNQASKATHAEFKATQEEFSAVETSFKEASQKLETAADKCEASYSAYNLCSALAKVRDGVEVDYAAAKKEVDTIDSENEETMSEATARLRTAITTIQDLDRRANDAVTTYEGDLLKAVRDEHSKLIGDTSTNLKEAKALLSTSQDKTSDEELWKAYSRILGVHEKELDKQRDVKGDEPDIYIASSEVLKVENAAIISTMNHLKEIYENVSEKTSSDEPSPESSSSASQGTSDEASPSESQSPKDAK